MSATITIEVEVEFDAPQHIGKYDSLQDMAMMERERVVSRIKGFKVLRSCYALDTATHRPYNRNGVAPFALRGHESND